MELPLLLFKLLNARLEALFQQMVVCVSVSFNLISNLIEFLFEVFLLRF